MVIRPVVTIPHLVQMRSMEIQQEMIIQRMAFIRCTLLRREVAIQLLDIIQEVQLLLDPTTW
jgi:hypothetical protein